MYQQYLFFFLFVTWGSSINDVTTTGERGLRATVLKPKALGGSKISQICVTSFMDDPVLNLQTLLKTTPCYFSRVPFKL